LSEFRVFETDEFLGRLQRLPSRDAALVRGKLSDYVYPQLKKAPCFGKNIKKLRRYDPDTWRYRIGRFRLFYSMDSEDGVIYMLTIDQRKDAYR